MTHSCISFDVCLEHLGAAKAQWIMLHPRYLLGNLTAVTSHKYSMSNQQEGKRLITAAHIKEINGDICTLQNKHLGGQQRKSSFRINNECRKQQQRIINSCSNSRVWRCDTGCIFMNRSLYILLSCSWLTTLWHNHIKKLHFLPSCSLHCWKQMHGAKKYCKVIFHPMFLQARVLILKLHPPTSNWTPKLYLRCLFWLITVQPLVLLPLSQMFLQ